MRKKTKTVKLNLTCEDGNQYHTNEDGSVVYVTKITNDSYFNNPSCCSKGGSSGLFPNYLEYNGWLGFNGLGRTDLDEIDDNWREGG